MKILAFGATGFIGPHIVRQLVDRGCEVVVFHRGETHAELPSSTRYIVGNRNRLSEFKTSFERLAPDVVLDVISYTEKHAADIVAAFTGIAHRLVVLSSGDVYRNYGGLWGREHHEPDPIPLAEDAPLRERWYPHRSQPSLSFADKNDYEKILVERVALSEPQLPGTVLRLPCVFGPGDRHHRLRPYLKRMEDGRPAILLDERQADWRWTRGYVENVAAAIVLALLDERASGHVYNVGEREARTEAAWLWYAQARKRLDWVRCASVTRTLARSSENLVRLALPPGDRYEPPEGRARISRAHFRRRGLASNVGMGTFQCRARRHRGAV